MDVDFSRLRVETRWVNEDARKLCEHYQALMAEEVARAKREAEKMPYHAAETVQRRLTARLDPLCEEVVRLYSAYTMPAYTLTSPPDDSPPA